MTELPDFTHGDSQEQADRRGPSLGKYSSILRGSVDDLTCLLDPPWGVEAELEKPRLGGGGRSHLVPVLLVFRCVPEHREHRSGSLHRHPHSLEPAILGACDA